MSSSASNGGSSDILGADDRALLDEIAGIVGNDRVEQLAVTLKEIQRRSELPEEHDRHLSFGNGDRDLLVDLVEVIERARLDVDKDELLDQPARYKRSTLPEGKLPTFGEPDEDCGELIPEAMHYCDRCYDIKELPHNCYRYDCPMHGLHAVRRHAAGNDTFPGKVRKIGALRAMLDSRQTKPYVYQHFSVNPPMDFFWRSNDPLERGFQLVRELNDCFAAQGLVAYHPYRSKNESDIGFWKDVLGKGFEWDEVRKQLVPFGHFHVVGATPEKGVPGGAVTKALEAATGWVLERHTARGSSVSVYGNEEMARAVTYALSHALVYDTPTGRRRLAARLKGPDVNDAEAYEQYKQEHVSNVYEASRDTLGLEPPDMECGVPVSRTRISIPPGPESSTSSGTSSSSNATDLPDASNVDATGEVIVGSSGMADADGGGVPSTPSTSTTTATERCGGRLRHISSAGEVLPELVDRDDVDVADLDAAYRSYDAVMKAKGLDGTHDDRADIPEFEDRPPPD